MNFHKSNIIVAIAAVISSCTEHHAVKIAYEEDFRNGDLVFRCGNGVESRAVTSASSSIYSHVGILHFDTIRGEWMVVHAVPGESKPNEDDTLKYEPIAEFFSPMKAETGAFAKIRCNDTTAEAASLYALSKYRQRVVFDNDYSISDTTYLYCTELVWQSYLHQGIDITDGNREEAVTLICHDSVCIYPSTILNSSAIECVKTFPEEISSYIGH